MRRLKVAILADYLEEGWPSMDLVADMLLDRLQREHAATVEPTLIRPSLRRRATRLRALARDARAFGVDRIANRLWDYPRIASGLSGRFDLFHVVDHSYAQLVHRLPPGRTLVTCHDLDTFRSVLEPEFEPRSAWFRAMSRHILEGLKKAGHVACDSGATRDAVIRKAGVREDRATVVHNGPHPSCTPSPEVPAEREATRLLGRPGHTIDLLHVGSTIPRKRIDLLLRIVADVRRRKPTVRLIRVGGPFTAEQRALARDLGILDAVVVLPVLDRSTLAAVYRRSLLVLMPSEREGFGLPVLEALACGTPVVASDIPPLREVGAAAATYCAVDDVPAWASAVERLIDERTVAPSQWTLRREAAARRATAFSWSHYAANVMTIYTELAKDIAC
ncbi:MAG TPA: glycosyltransferase family 1 protein [Vicinamibacterales bacterium]|jgi:glycosyltransferase involved in cell wall biosynthesis|nr:glycosyltransferase family 1 protein [Vicinamibacterales bacterium]